MKNKKRTGSEIQAEIKALKDCLAYAPRKSLFGDDNHRGIQLQIEELAMGIDDTSDRWNDFSDSERGAIDEARYWKEGDSDETPSSGWDAWKPKKEQ